MGGGDLNLKKSWHPSTMKNMEKVWKAEQKHDQEKKRIAELQREIREEKAREDIIKFAEDQGVIEKKDDMKLDWMYKGPGGIVDREEYLLGRSIDKSFELLEKSEKAASTSLAAKSNAECIPNSIFMGGDEQVDMARKLQEDPLYAIKKKEMESRSQILKNPVKLKQLQEFLKEQTSKKSKKSKKEKKKRKDRRRNKSSSDESSGNDDLDAILLSKYKKLRDKIQLTEIKKLRKSSSSESLDDAEDRGRNNKKHVSNSNHRKRNRDSSESSDDAEDESRINKKHVSNSNDRKRNHGSSESSDDAEDGGRNNKKHVSNSNHRKRNYDSSDEDGNNGKARKTYGLSKVPNVKPEKNSMKQTRPRTPPRNRNPSKPQWVKPERRKLSDEELERQRQEMMANAKWREKEREKNVAKYREEEKKDKKKTKDFSEDFMRKQLSHAASQSSVESRIKSNINHIQRSGMSMDKHFARR